MAARLQGAACGQGFASELVLWYSDPLMATEADLALRLGIDRDDELPVGVQLAWKLRGAIASGRLAPGDRLPSVRDLAAASGVNVNTARAVYGKLERDGFISTQHGLGTFVAAAAESSAEVERVAAAAVTEARTEGIDPRDVARAIYASEWALEGDPAIARDPLPDIGAEADEAAARRELRRQIARLEAELASYPAARSDAEAVHPLLRAKGHVASFAELEATRNELMERLKAARVAEEKRGRREERARLRREGMLRDPERHRFERIALEECGDPGCGEFRVVPRFGPVGALAGWWRVKVSSGCP
jgi:DNA-binding transcriptional regulator YhcF (GntR family)